MIVVTSKRSCIAPVRGFFTGIVIAAGLAAVPIWASTPSGAVPHPVALEKWRAAMAEKPPQEAGCYHASYPSLVREKVECAVAHAGVHPMHRERGADEPAIVGNGADYAAQTKDKTFWAGGSFSDVTMGSEYSVGVQSFDDQGTLGPDEYSLQVNTNDNGVTSACGHSTTFSCHVWQQFVYATDYDCDLWGCSSAVFIQLWLLDYGECPDNWNQESPGSSNCWVNAALLDAPRFSSTDLNNLSLHAAAHAGGQDCVELYDNTGEGWGACVSDTALHISSVWDQTEFGIFGDNGGSQAQFGFGTSFTQLLQVNDGSGAKPTCLKNAGTTGETNNLTAGSCEALVGDGMFPRIKFTEANHFSAPAAPKTCGKILPGQGLTPGHSWHSCDGRFTLDMQTDSNLVLYEGHAALWNTDTVGQNAAFVVMQEDGNLVLYDKSRNAVWQSGTPGYETAYLAIQDDGNLVVYYTGHDAVWNSGTCCH
jgi:hypothetical protein